MNICFHTWGRFGNCWQRIWKLCNVSQKQYINRPKPKFPENSLIFYCFLKFPGELGKFPEISLIFHGKAISLSFPECVGTLWKCIWNHRLWNGHNFVQGVMRELVHWVTKSCHPEISPIFIHTDHFRIQFACYQFPWVSSIRDEVILGLTLVPGDIPISYKMFYSDSFMYAPSQWETRLL